MAFLFRRESSKKISRWRLWLQSWNSDWKYLLFLLYKSSQYFLPNFKSTGLSVQEKKRKKIFEIAAMAAILDFWLECFSYFSSAVTLILPNEFGVKSLLGSGEKNQNKFSSWPPWQPFWISEQNDFSHFWSIHGPDFPTKFGTSWPFGSGEEAQNRFSRCWLWRPTWISDRNHFSSFWSTGCPDNSTKFWVICLRGVEGDVI